MSQGKTEVQRMEATVTAGFDIARKTMDMK
jgi:hypothetical protein